MRDGLRLVGGFPALQVIYSGTAPPEVKIWWLEIHPPPPATNSEWRRKNCAGVVVFPLNKS